MNKFKPIVSEKLGWYVYALRNPCNQHIFYVGKGTRNRIFEHAHSAKATENTESVKKSEKIELIQSIISDGFEVEAFIIQHAIPSEGQAYAIECALLDFSNLKGIVDLKNLMAGRYSHSFGLMSVDTVKSLYDAPKAPPITEPTLLIRIPQLWTPQMTDKDLFEATHGWWKVGPRREKAKYVFSVNRGVIRGVYHIGRWRPRVKGDRDWKDDIGKPPRWGFNGQHAPEMAQFLNTSVRHLFKRGEASPVKYLNC